ncbi:MAG TPA: uL15m family ribosomal protein, partial [Chlamydiales bacterium]|nr:uL15m family ribosomal protein [Chlamydiales bacterium]
RLDSINLDQIEKLYSNGQVVNVESLKQLGYIKGDTNGIKVLGRGELTKKLTFEVTLISSSAEEKLKAAGCSYTIVA